MLQQATIVAQEEEEAETLQVRIKNDEFCIKHDEFVSKNHEFRMKMMILLLNNDTFAADR